MENQTSDNPLIKELESIRKDGSLKNIPRILEILRDHPENEEGKVAIALLADIKDSKIITILVDSLQNNDNQAIRKQLVRICWESGLNYSAHLAYFTDLFLTLELEVALEAFSLVENTVLDHEPEKAIKEEIITKIKTVILDLSELKQTLAMDLIHQLS